MWKNVYIYIAHLNIVSLQAKPTFHIPRCGAQFTSKLEGLELGSWRTAMMVYSNLDLRKKHQETPQIWIVKAIFARTTSNLVYLDGTINLFVNRFTMKSTHRRLNRSDCFDLGMLTDLSLALDTQKDFKPLAEN